MSTEPPPPYNPSLKPGQTGDGYTSYQNPPPFTQEPVGTTVIYEIPALQLTRYPTSTVCSNCSNHVQTVVEPTPGLLTYMLAGGLCLVGCWFGCCLIPFCMDSVKDFEHRCPNCNAMVKF